MNPIKIAKSTIKIFSCTYSTPYGYKLDYLKSHFIKITHPLPWMNYKAIEYIINRIANIETVFEYGSGQSTLFWLSMHKTVVSVEHDSAFYKKLWAQISTGSKLDYQLIPPEVVQVQDIYDPANPSHYQSSDDRCHIFKKYVEAIDVFNDESFDIVVIDGRARPSCIMHAVRKIKPNGMLILDNSNREYYLKNTAHLFLNWKRHDFTGTVRGLLHQEKTSFFIKPINQLELR